MSTIEKYFRTLVKSGYTISELANHNLRGGGKSGRKALDANKVEAFVTYAISSWNEFHSKNEKTKHWVIHETRRSISVSGLRRTMNQICDDFTRRFGS